MKGLPHHRKACGAVVRLLVIAGGACLVLPGASPARSDVPGLRVHALFGSPSSTTPSSRATRFEEERAPSHPMPEPGLLASPRTSRSARRAGAGSARIPLSFQDIDLTGEAERPADGLSAALAPEAAEVIERLTTLLAPARDANVGDARPAKRTGRDAPWSANHLLADAMHMNDEYVSLAVNPVNGNLYSTFEAKDLGGTDRDIHIAKSANGGATWQVWEMPSFSQDEYHSEIAVDAAGYLYVTWIRADGYILRSKSTSPDSPTSWAWVKGLNVGETCATPSIAVSGSGASAKVFIASAWYTINYDLYAYEWTLIWMYSTNGGTTVTYDYFVPDGYQDYWPDVAMNGNTVYFANAEQDYSTGEVEVLVAEDVLSGGFASPFSLSDWTSMDCRFPRIAADGLNVYAVFQLDFDDGAGNIDGDVIYCFSWDGLATVYGPYEMVADEYESVGPCIYTRGGVVGCLWLDAPAGGDEFDVAARQAGGYGHPDLWGDIETVTDQNYADPTFHCASGAATGSKLHAAWIDRRDYPTQGLSVYTSDRSALANLAPFVPEGWGGTLVASMIEGERTTGWLAANDTNYVSFAFLNDGLADVAADFRIALKVDGVEREAWTLEGGLPVGYYVTVEDHPLVVPAGPHTVSYVIDTQGVVPESDETDNTHAETWTFIDGDPLLRFDPEYVVHTFPAPGLSRDEAMRAASDPPLREEVEVPVLDARLSAALREADEATMHRVMIVPAARVDALALSKRLEGAGRAELREAILGALKKRSARNEAALSGAWDADVRAGRMTRPEALWLSGTFSARMRRDAVLRLAENPAIGRIWLDDARCEPFSLPADADETGAASAPKTGSRALAWHLSRIGADQAWAQGYDGSGVRVGHMDSGVAYDHPDLAGHLWDGGASHPHHGYDMVDEDDDPYDGDTEWHHGTHTAGLVVGDGAAGTTTGAAPGAELMILRCVPGYQADVVEALQFGLDHGANVFSFSAGWSQGSDALREANRSAAEVLLAAGIPWIVAAGNGDNAGGHYPVPTDISSPADCPDPWYGAAGHSSVIAVGATTQADGVSPMSSYGPTAWDIPSASGDYDDYPHPPGLMKPDVAAPGVNITSTTPPSGYVAYDGTSMAAPLVTGASAILMQAGPGLLPSQIAEALESGAIDLVASPGSPGRDNFSGAGRLDIPAAIAHLPASEAEFFRVHNDGTLPLLIDEVAWSATWLQVFPVSAHIAPGDSLRFTALFEPEGLSSGVHTEDVSFTTNDPASPHFFPVTAVVGDATNVPPGPGAPMRPLSIENRPNPFNPETVIRFTIPKPARAVLSVHDLAGRRVAVLSDGPREAGVFSVSWGGNDDGGRPVASGVYFVRLQAGEYAATRKVSLIR